MPGKDKSKSNSKESGAAAETPEFSLISPEKLLELYAAMVRERALLLRVCASPAIPKDKPNRMRLVEGSGASLAGATIDLGRGDVILPPTIRLLAESARSGAAGRFARLVAGPGNRRRSAAVSLESAVHAARIRKQKRTGKIVVAFAEVREGDHSTWGRSLASAVKQKLPVVYVAQVQDVNGAGVAGFVEDGRAVIAGLPVIVVDGDDAVAVYRVAYEAIARARRGLGPTLIECRPYIVEARSNATENSRRPRTAEPSRVTDPIVGMEAYLRRKGLFTPQVRRQIEVAFAAQFNPHG